MTFINGLPWRQPVLSSPEDLSPRARVLSFPALDGVRLEGYFAPPLADRPILVVQAGKRATRDHMLPWARVLAESGYGVFTFDWRAQGESEGWILSYGAHGPVDLLGALRALEEQPEAQGKPIGIYACSLGAACVAMTGGDLPASVRALLLDSPYGDLGRMAHDRLKFLGPLRWLPWLMVAFFGKVLLGVSVPRIKPEESLVAFAPRPIFVMHGDADTVVPYDEGVALHARYPGPKDFWTDPGLDHVDARIMDTRGWMRRVTTFFHEHLPGAPDPEAVLARTPETLTEPTCLETYQRWAQEELQALEERLEEELGLGDEVA
jgi:fermentation-respiration switch protein FrsA (DUF1100 family)